MRAKSKINRKYTWRPSLPDFRDYKYTAAAIVIPTSVDLRPQDVPVYNQGQLGSCFSGDTEIKLLNGEIKTIKELAETKSEFWVYSCDESGSMFPGKAVSKLTGIDKEVIKVTLDNGEEIICTPDHEFMLRDGSYKKVSEISFKESLMPNYLRVGPNGYEQFFSNTKNKWINTHSAVNNLINYDIESIEESALNYNHKIVNIEKLESKIDVYCLSVEKYHNFALKSGVYVHNCTANAWAGAFQFTKKKEKKSDWAPSRLFIYYNERVIEGTPTTDSGAQLRDGAQTLSTQGTCAESMWLYSDDATKFAIKPPTNCYTQGLPHKITSYMSIDNTVINNLKSCLASGYTFVFGFTVYESFESQAVASTGVVPMPLPNEEVLGGHAVEAVGYNDSMNAFIIRNSWGTGWGIPNSAGIGTGYFWMPYAYITNANLASDFWTIRMDS